MSTDSKEHLSQLMDGEISGDTGRFLLRRLENNLELRGTWARYHMIRDCLRHQESAFATGDLCSRVRMALAGEAASTTQATGGILPARWLRPAAGFAIAASVALMAVVAVAPNLQIGDDPASPQLASPATQPFSSPNILSRGRVSRQVNFAGASQPAARRMNSYLLRHYQVAGESGGSGFVAFMPIVVTKAPSQQVAGDGRENPSQDRQDADPSSP